MTFGRVGGASPGIAGAATEHPLERVESNGVRTRGRLSPSYTKRTALLQSFKCFGPYRFAPG